MMIRTEASRFILLSVAMLTGVCVWNMAARVPQPARRAWGLSEEANATPVRVLANATPCPSPNNINVLLYTPEGHQHVPSRKLDDDGLAPLTRWAQTEIHRRMNPPDCSKAKFLVTHGWPHGIGSTLHVTGTHLAYAIQNQLVLEWGSGTCANFLDASECAAIGVGCACLFQRLTSCPREVVEANSVGTIQKTDYQHIVPDVFRQAIQREVPNIQEPEIRFWWRAQSVAYLARFNNVTLDAVTAMRHQAIHFYKTHHRAGHNVTPPFPLPPGTINAHIRHGDKVLEMKLVPSEDYFHAAQRMAHRQPLSFGRRTLFVSSDDADAVETNRRLAEDARWGFVFSRIYRMDGGFDSERWGTISASSRLSTMYTQLLQLLMSLESDAWVGTRASNGNRLIDELRCVWVHKCRNVYVDVGYLQQEMDYAW